MPEYHMPEKDTSEFQSLDAFTRGYIECMFFTNSASGIYMTDWHEDYVQHDLREGMLDGTLPADAGFLDLHPDTLASIIADCSEFQRVNADLIAQAIAIKQRTGEDVYPYGAEYAGHDFWLTRNGHGVGFWDRQLGEGGEKLTEACKAYGEVFVDFGDLDEASPTGYGWVYTH